MSEPAQMKAPTPLTTKTNLVSQAEIGRIFGAARKTVKEWVDFGCPVADKGTKGQGQAILYDTVAVYKWLLARKTGGSESPLFKSKLATQEENLKKLERENKIAEGRLVNIDFVERNLVTATLIFKNSIEGFAGRLASGDATLRKQLLEEVRELERDIAKRFRESFKP